LPAGDGFRAAARPLFFAARGHLRIITLFDVTRANTQPRMSSRGAAQIGASDGVVRADHDVFSRASRTGNVRRRSYVRHVREVGIRAASGRQNQRSADVNIAPVR
jgi:hypothetical protein